MDKTLIVKTGATGDVVRTTPLLHVIEGEIHWLTLEYNKLILPGDCPHLTRVFSIENDLEEVKKQSYSKIISLEEDRMLCSFISELTCSSYSGLFMNEDKIRYTPDSALLFDMSLMSALDKNKANEMKFINTLSYQDLIFRLAGHEFDGHRYWINKPALQKMKSGRKIGIESRAGERWKGKIWYGYDRLASMLENQGYETFFFSQKNSLEEYLMDISSCDYIIAGDTLAMHLALAFEIPGIAIFICTSPAEIYDYGIMKKIINPNLKNCFYKTSVKPADSSLIEVEEVMETFLQIAGQQSPVIKGH